MYEKLRKELGADGLDEELIRYFYDNGSAWVNAVNTAYDYHFPNSEDIGVDEEYDKLVDLLGETGTENELLSYFYDSEWWADGICVVYDKTFGK